MIMTIESQCRCSMDILQIMSDLQNVQAVVDVDVILDLIHRLCRQGKTFVQCESCTETTQTSIVTLPALSEQCLPLLEALCSAYNTTGQPGFFDSAMLAFEQPPSSFICIRSKVILGQTELDEDEARLLVRTLLGRSLIGLVELMESLKSKLLLMLDKPHGQRNGTATLRACELSVESTISRLAGLIQSIEGECDNGALS